jgi:GT2 family glycosyltransferase
VSRISVVLPYRDAAPTLGDAVASVLADLGADDELVLVDDGSSDGSADIARGVAARDPRVVGLASGGTPERAAGFVPSLTRGIDAARGTLIGRMDADDVSLPGRFAAERRLLESDVRLGAVGVQIEVFPAPGPGMVRYVAWQSSLVSRADHARAIFVESPLCHPSTLIRRDALVAVGGYRVMPWASDYDLWLRLDAAGYGLAKVPEVLFRWRVSDGSMTWTAAHNARARFVEARAHYLARRLRERGGAGEFAVWGAGQTGRRLARALEAHGLFALAFIDIDPRKVGRVARGVAIVDATAGIARAQRGELTIVVAVGDTGARDIVRARLTSAGLVEGETFVCAA